MKSNKETQVEQLAESAKAAFDSGDFNRAKALALQGLKLAPFRKDLKDIFTESIEKSKSGVAPQPLTSSDSQSHHVSQPKPQQYYQSQQPQQAPSTIHSAPTESYHPAGYQQHEQIPSQPGHSMQAPPTIHSAPTQPYHPAPSQPAYQQPVPGTSQQPWQKPFQQPQYQEPGPVQQSSIHEAKTEVPVTHIPAHHKSSKMKVRNNSRAMLWIFLFGFMAFIAVAGFLFFGEGIKAALMNIVKREPPIDPKQKEAIVKIDQARASIIQNNKEAAISTLEGALEANPPDPEPVRKLLAQTYFDMGNDLYNGDKFKESIDFFKKAVDMYPKNKDFLKYFGHAYFERARRNKLDGYPVFREQMDKAIEIYNAAIKISEEEHGQPDLDIYQSLGRAYIANNKQIEFLQINQKILEIAPSDSQYVKTAKNNIESITGRKVDLPAPNSTTGTDTISNPASQPSK